MKDTRSQILKADFQAFWILATIALCAGLVINQFRDKPLPLVSQTKEQRMEFAVARLAQQEAKPNVSSDKLPDDLTLEQFENFVNQKQGLVLDARPEIFHRLSHVPGSLSLPRDEFETGYAKIKNQLERDKNQPLAVYCASSSCEDSDLVRKALSRLGYTQVAVFHGGWAQWTVAGKPQEKNL